MGLVFRETASPSTGPPLIWQLAGPRPVHGWLLLFPVTVDAPISATVSGVGCERRCGSTDQLGRSRTVGLILSFGRRDRTPPGWIFRVLVVMSGTFWLACLESERQRNSMNLVDSMIHLFGRAAVLFMIAAVRSYQILLAPHLTGGCRHVPSCSEYSIAAFGRHGPWKGLRLTAARLWRCRPRGTYGYDPVP